MEAKFIAQFGGISKSFSVTLGHEPLIIPLWSLGSMIVALSMARDQLGDVRAVYTVHSNTV